MSWTDKRLSLPFMAHNRSHSLTNSQYSDRNVELNKVLAAYLRKLKTMRKKWFVLYAASAVQPAHLEYYENDRKWRAGSAPSREIILKDCFNICKKQDTRDSKNKHVIAIYTLDDCLSILFEEEQDLRNWLIQLLSHQKGKAEDGKIPRPNFENMWQVNVKIFKPENPDNAFVMSGPYRLCVTRDDLKFFPVGSNTPISFPIVSLRSCVCNDRQFQLQTGRSSFSGAGTLFIYSDDKEISANLNIAVRDAMEYKRQNHEKINLPSHIQRSLRTKDGLTESSSNVNNSTYRPRSESCSEIDKVKKTVTSAPKATPHQRPATTNPASMFNSTVSRYRTISEGNHADFHRKRGKASALFGSPMSPSPGSCVSSESAGSSNSIDDVEYGIDRKQYMSSATDPQPTTIYEESSAESFLDPSAYRDLSDSSPTVSPPTGSEGISHMRTSSDIVHYTPVDVGPCVSSSPVSRRAAAATASTTSATTSTFYPSIHYAVILGQQQQQMSSVTASPSDYIAMTPTSGNTSSTSSLKRHSSLDQTGAEQRRLVLLGLSEEAIRAGADVGGGGSSTATITSPSSQSSYNPLDDVDDATTTPSYHVMSPSSGLGKSIPLKKPPANANTERISEDEYMSMSPSSKQALLAASSTVRSRANMAIPLHENLESQSASMAAERNSGERRQEYEVMSPVSLDPEKLRRISEEDNSAQPLSAIEERLGSGYLGGGGARPKFPRASAVAPSGGSKRSSFCSDGGDLDEHFLHHPLDEDIGSGTEIPDDNLEYVTMNYGRSAIPSSFPIPALLSSARLSPASSGSLVSGTPNSVDARFARFPADFHFETKARSYLRQDDDVTEAAGHLPLRAYSVSNNRTVSSSSTSLSGRSRSGSITHQVDIPPRNKQLSPSSQQSSKGGKTTTASGSGQSPNLISRLDHWIRSRAGSVPSRQQYSDRRRHRTQSEGEKDSPENQDATEQKGDNASSLSPTKS